MQPGISTCFRSIVGHPAATIAFPNIGLPNRRQGIEKSPENPKGAKVSTLSRAPRGPSAAGEGPFLDDFLDFPNPWWTVGADDRLSFLIIDPDKGIRVFLVGRGGLGAHSASKGRKTRKIPSNRQNRTMICPARVQFLTF